MGKSPGKWIKTILFGKKHSKSTLSKNGTPDKKTAVKTPVEDLSGDYLVISDPCQSTERGVENSELDKGTSGSHCDPIALSPANQVVVSLSNNASLPHSDAETGRQEQAAAKAVSLSNNASLPHSDAETGRQEQAAAKAQAAFRGYLARRAFRALKGIIRLQALIRGHLVRRQAVATLRCMQAIVKFQASIQGRKVKSGSNLLFGSEKLAKNIFVRKLLVKLPTAMPLSFQYDLAESNSAWNWLERWSASHFWEPPTQTKKILKAKPQKKQGGTQVVGSEYGKSRRTIRSVPAVTNGENCALASSEMDKPKHHTRKAASNQTEMVEEQPHNELERVKRNLRKISESAAVAASEKSEIDTKKPQPQLHQSVEMETNSASPDVSKQEVAISSENLGNSDVVIDKGESLEAPPNTTIDEPVDVTHDNDPVVDTHSLDNGVKMESPPTMDDELSCKEEKSRKDNHKVRKKRSVPSKQECSENSSQNSPCLPSYMAATESAKAKLRAQGSPKFGEDGDENGYTRRHSLPASANGKLSLLSPGIQKHVQGNGKGGSKTNRSLTSSRDDKVVVQPGWRR